MYYLCSVYFNAFTDMDFLYSLLMGIPDAFSGGVAHSLFILALVIGVGIALGQIKIGGVSLGVTWILFTGIIFSHFGMNLDPRILHFIKELGLILFVYSIGLQVGPGFFAAFRSGGVKLNLLAVISILLTISLTISIHYITGINISTTVGIMQGAVTNTPGLGAAQQAYFDLTGNAEPSIALGYAVAYPLGVVGTILSLLGLRYIFRIDKNKEETSAVNALGSADLDVVKSTTFSVENKGVVGIPIRDLGPLIQRKFVISRLYRESASDSHCVTGVSLVTGDTLLQLNDRILVITTPGDVPALESFFGRSVEMNWKEYDTELISRRILITKPELNGRALSDLRIRNNFGANITRVNRAGLDLVAAPNLQLQMGDRVTVVGSRMAVANAEKVMGNSLKRLDHPNLIPIFIGIAFGVLIGTIPFMLPGIPQPVKLGLAGGPLIVAILISRFGPQFKLVTYTTASANLMLREVGISLFLACVGLEAGDNFVHTIVHGGGLVWIGYGALITVVPVLITGLIGRYFFKLNYYTLTGVLSGANTNPPALAFASSQTNLDSPAVGYATVYPLAMFLRVITAQILILSFS